MVILVSSKVKTVVDYAKGKGRWGYNRDEYDIETTHLSPTKARYPVYRVVIRYPVIDASNIVRVREKEVANTSLNIVQTAASQLRQQQNPIIGIWIDQTSNDSDPDKAQIILHNTVDNNDSTKSWVDDDAIAGRNWIDIWLGYRQTALSLSRWLNTNFSSLGSSALGAASRLIGTNNAVYPDNFEYGNLTHVFSGQIVKTDRNISSNGDRLTLTAFAPQYVLQGIPSYSAHNAWRLCTVGHSGQELMSVWNALDGVMKSIYTSPINVSDSGAINSLEELIIQGYSPASSPLLRAGQIPPFFCGAFTYQMFNFDSGAIRDFTAVADPELTQLFDEQVLRPFETPVKANNLWDVLYAFTRHEITGIEGVALTFYSGSDGRLVPTYYRKRKMEEHITRSNKDKPIYEMILGKNVVDTTLSLEIPNIFNEVDFIHADRDLDGYEGLDRYSFPYCKGLLSSGAIDSDTELNLMLSELNNPDNNPEVREQLDLMKQDYIIYGARKYPEVKKLHRGNSLFNMRTLSEFLSRHAFGGMDSELMTLGDPRISPNELIVLRDNRKGFTGAVTGAALRDTGIIDKATGVFSGGEKSAGVSQWFKTNRLIDNIFYVWKVRHFLGVGSGYTTKVYYQEQPRFDEIKFSGEVGGAIEAALGRMSGR
jgi:hypothetical protein